MSINWTRPGLLRPILFGWFLCIGGATASADSATVPAPGFGRVPRYFLEIPASVPDVLVADTGAARLYRFSIAANRITGHDERYMSIGQNGAGKKRAWDKKTPLGVYFITERVDTTGLDARYGAAAFVLDYPNAWDRYNSRTGHGIWIHGVDHERPRRPPRDTDGCLALPNDELLQLAGHLKPYETPVIVARKVDWAEPSELDALRLEFHVALNRWRHSLERNDRQAYLDLYADTFTYNGLNKEQWSTYRLSSFASGTPKEVRIENLILLADPEEPDLYISRFTQITRGIGAALASTKRLYWRRGEDAEWRILSEDNG